MGTGIYESLPTAPPAPAGRPGEDPRRRLWRVLAALDPTHKRIERRSRCRYPYPYLIRLTPVGAGGIALEGESVVVVGKHLSEQGLGFYHPMPLPHRRMIACLEAAVGNPLRLLVDLTWCRFTQGGWYESGGRFLQVVPLCEGPADC